MICKIDFLSEETYMKQPTIITGTVGMDTHVIGTKILSRAFREAGFNVVELGL